MSNTIEINEKELRSVISEAVRNVLKEDNNINTNSRGETIALSSQFSDGLSDLENMYERLKGFIGEYPIVIRSLLKSTRELGLELKDFSTDRFFDLADAFSGQVYSFDFEFVVPGIDSTSMSDEEYEQFEDKLNNIYDELEYKIGKPSFGTFRMYTTEEGIQVEYAFKLK